MSFAPIIEIIDNLSTSGLFALFSLICIFTSIARSLLYKISEVPEGFDLENELAILIEVIIVVINVPSWVGAIGFGIKLIFEFLE
jgi:hypothetical protein